MNSTSENQNFEENITNIIICISLILTFLFSYFYKIIIRWKTGL